MARPLEFDRSEALERAVDAFWRDGYEAVSANGLADAMGVAKSSLYNTFGSKRDLLIEALSFYSNRTISSVRAALKGPDLAAQLRSMLLDIARNNDGGRGCFFVNIVAEMGLCDAEVREHVKAGFERMESALETLLQAGQASGHINAKVDAAKYATVLVGGIAGLRVLAKSGFCDEQLMPVVDSLLTVLQP